MRLVLAYLAVLALAAVGLFVPLANLAAWIAMGIWTGVALRYV